MESLIPSVYKEGKEPKQELLNRALQFREEMSKFTGDLNNLLVDDGTKFGDKIDKLLGMHLALLPLILLELDPSNNIIDTEKVDHIQKIMGVLNKMEASLYKKRDMEIKEEVDLGHPKFQKALEWVVESILLSMTEVKISSEAQGNFIRNFSTRMIGFEESANKKLKGRSFQTLDELKNPLIKEFNEGRKDG